MPGFLPEESLPVTPEAIVEVLAESLRKAAGDRPFALLGYSSACVLAHACQAASRSMANGLPGVPGRCLMPGGGTGRY